MATEVAVSTGPAGVSVATEVGVAAQTEDVASSFPSITISTRPLLELHPGELKIIIGLGVPAGLIRQSAPPTITFPCSCAAS